MQSRAPRVAKTRAVVLSHRRLGDADRIVTLLTPVRGKVDAVARGVLRTRSKLAGHLEPLTESEVMLAHGRSLDLVTAAQTIESFRAIHGDLDRLGSALYLLELADRFTVEGQGAGEIYRLLLRSLHRLAAGDGLQLVTRTFELALLAATGFRPELDCCLVSALPVAAEEAYWSALAGGVLSRAALREHPEAVRIDARALRVLRAFQALSYEEASRIRIDGELARELERVMHAFVRAQAERGIRSQDFIGEARQAGRGAEAMRTPPPAPESRDAPAGDAPTSGAR